MTLRGIAPATALGVVVATLALWPAGAGADQLNCGKTPAGRPYEVAVDMATSTDYLDAAEPSEGGTQAARASAASTDAAARRRDVSGTTPILPESGGYGAQPPRRSVACRAAMRPVLVLSVVLLTLAAAAPAGAATVLGSVDGTPSAACNAPYDCTFTQSDGTLTVPADGVIVQWRVHHGATPSGGSIPTVSLRALTGPDSGATARLLTGSQSVSSGDAIDTFGSTDDYNRPNGIPVAAGERIALYSSEPGEPLLAAGSGASEKAGNHAPGATGTYAARAGLRLLLEVRIEPDADKDGYGDETQDACVGSCPAPPSSPAPGGGTTGGTPSGDPGVQPGPPAQEVKWYSSGSIEAFKAQEVTVYRAPTIKRLPATTNLAQAILRGFSAPVNCSAACQITAYASMRAISGALLGFASRKAHRPRVVKVAKASGKFPTAGTGRLRLKLPKSTVKKLRRVHGHRIRMQITITVRDGRKTTVRRQVVTLRRR